MSPQILKYSIIFSYKSQNRKLTEDQGGNYRSSFGLYPNVLCCWFQGPWKHTHSSGKQISILNKGFRITMRTCTIFCLEIDSIQNKKLVVYNGYRDTSGWMLRAASSAHYVQQCCRAPSSSQVTFHNFFELLPQVMSCSTMLSSSSLKSCHVQQC